MTRREVAMKRIESIVRSPMPLGAARFALRGAETIAGLEREVAAIEAALAPAKDALSAIAEAHRRTAALVQSAHPPSMRPPTAAYERAVIYARETERRIRSLVAELTRKLDGRRKALEETRGHWPERGWR
jgi:hypothetical protein